MRPTYGAATWLFLRILGVVYFIAFCSLAVQVVGLIGRDGILPAQEYMDGARAFVAAHGVGVDRFRLLPTLCWISTSDAFLRGLCYGGAALALLLVVGVMPVPVLVALWIDYLSLSVVSREFLSYQWDALLLEAGLIAVFLAPPVLRERSEAPVDPPAVARWLAVWLLVRLMVGSGAVKLASGDPTWRNLTAMAYHYETQPIPTPVAWYAARLPLVFQKVSTAAVIAIELVAPWGAFAARRWRLAAVALLVGLQVLVALTGNYAFFNLLSVALCLWCLDDETIRRIRRLPAPVPAAARAPHPSQRGVRRVAAAAFAIVTVPVSVMMFLGSCGVDFAPPLVRDVADLVAPLRSVNGYGLFAVMTTTRDEIVIEGSNDGVTWQAYEFEYKPGDPNRRPPWVAPHQPRLDWQMWFASLTTYQNVPWYQNFCARLLQGSPAVLALLAHNPFPGRPPRYLRGTLYRYHYGRATWWTRERIGDYSPVVHLNS